MSVEGSADRAKPMPANGAVSGENYRGQEHHADPFKWAPRRVNVALQYSNVGRVKPVVLPNSEQSLNDLAMMTVDDKLRLIFERVSAAKAPVGDDLRIAAMKEALALDVSDATERGIQIIVGTPSVAGLPDVPKQRQSSNRVDSYTVTIVFPYKDGMVHLSEQCATLAGGDIVRGVLPSGAELSEIDRLVTENGELRLETPVEKYNRLLQEVQLTSMVVVEQRTVVADAQVKGVRPGTERNILVNEARRYAGRISRYLTAAEELRTVYPHLADALTIRHGDDPAESRVIAHPITEVDSSRFTDEKAISTLVVAPTSYTLDMTDLYEGKKAEIEKKIGELPVSVATVQIDSENMETIPEPSDALKYITAILGDPVRVAALTSSDGNTASTALHVAKERIAELQPKSPYKVDDARLELASLLISRLPSEINQQRREASLRLLSQVQLTEAHAEILQKVSIHAINSLDATKFPGGRIGALVEAMDIIGSYLPHNRASGKEVMQAWGDFISTFPDEGKKEALLKSVSGIFRRPGISRRLLSSEESEWQDGAIIAVYNMDDRLSYQNIADLFGTGQSLICKLIKHAENEQEPQIGDSTGRGLAEEGMNAVVGNFLSELPQEVHEIVLMRYKEQLSLRAIAERTRFQRNTVDIRLKRVRGVLAERLGPLPEGVTVNDILEAIVGPAESEGWDVEGLQQPIPPSVREADIIKTEGASVSQSDDVDVGAWTVGSHRSAASERSGDQSTMPRVIFMGMDGESISFSQPEETSTDRSTGRE